MKETERAASNSVRAVRLRLFGALLALGAGVAALIVVILLVRSVLA